MARLGSSQPIEMRMTLDELADGFAFDQFGASPTKFDAEDLWPLTREANQARPFEVVRDRIKALGVPDALAERFWRVASQNIIKLDDLGGWWRSSRKAPRPRSTRGCRIHRRGDDAAAAAAHTDTSWAEFTSAVKEATGRKGKGLFMPLRKALTGQAHGPDMSDVMPLLQVVRAVP